MEMRLNREFAVRHLFVALLLAGMAAWFAYDGFVRYSSATAHDLYVAIEKREPAEGFDLEAFKRQKTQTQYGLAAFFLLASVAVGAHLLAVSRFRFAFDGDGFTSGGRRYGFADIVSVDRSRWESKRIAGLALKDGRRVTLDAWHHDGVKEFVASLDAAADSAAAKVACPE